MVTVSATNATVKKAVTATFTLTVPNLWCEALPNLDPATDAYGTLTAGVAFDSSLVDCWTEDGYKVSVSGLPTGLKWNAKVGTITGVPTKAGIYTVTFTATKGREKQIATITLSVEALPDWAQGTFYGYLDNAYLDGLATMTVSSNGRISGKFFCDGTNYTFTAPSFSSCGTDYVNRYYMDATVIAKAGRESFEMGLLLRACDGMMSEDGVEMLVNSCAELGSELCGFSLYRNMWKDKATANVAKKILAGLEGMYTSQLEADHMGAGYLSLVVGKDGNVKATGKLPDGTAVSASAPILSYDDRPFACLGKNGVFMLYLEEISKLEVRGNGEWKCRQLAIEGEYDVCGLGIHGAFYDKSKKLGDYCEKLWFGCEDVTELHGTCKHTYLNEYNRKDSYSELLWIQPSNSLGPEVPATVDRNGKITVPKATKPLQDKESGEWRYEGENDGALTLSFSQATGIFKGTYTLWFDYESAVDETTDRVTWTHTSKKINFEGIVVQGEPYFSGFYLWDAVGVYWDAKTDQEKTYKYKQSKRVGFGMEVP